MTALRAAWDRTGPHSQAVPVDSVGLWSGALFYPCAGRNGRRHGRDECPSARSSAVAFRSSPFLCASCESVTSVYSASRTVEDEWQKPLSGMIGLGIMGSAIAANLMRARFRVTGYDVVAAKRRDLARAGGAAARSVADVGNAADIVIRSLPSAASLLDVATAAGARAAASEYVIETSTLPIAVKEEARRRLAAARTTLLDCPISGTGAQARDRRRRRVCQRSEARLSAVAPVMDGFARAHYYVGPFGAGSKTKFVANLLVAIHNVAAAEAIVLAMKAGLDPGDDAEGDRRRGRQLADAAGARADDGARATTRTRRSTLSIFAKDMDDHRRLRAPGGMPDAAPGRDGAHIHGGAGDGARGGRHGSRLRGAGSDGRSPPRSPRLATALQTAARLTKLAKSPTFLYSAQ